MKKLLMVLLVLLVAGGGLFVWQAHHKQTQPKIGILQWASHPALDAVREGFTAQIREEFGDQIGIEAQNAEGLLGQARLIATKFHSSPDIVAVLTIATPATQVMASVEAKKPIIFAAVTDATLIGSWDGRSNLAGVEDRIDVPATVALATALLPQAQQVALVHDPAEPNSRSLVTAFETALQEKGLKSFRVGVSSSQEMASSAAIAAQKADLILTPTDNTVAATFDILSRQAKMSGVPIIACDNLMVPKGAVAARGIDYRESGRKAAQLAAQILNGRRPADLPVEKPVQAEVVTNAERLEALHLSLPSQFQEPSSHDR
jgi:putative tryptophan/tyrosine transport system substrate-binding protein